MIVINNYKVAKLTTLGVGGSAKKFTRLRSQSDYVNAFDIAKSDGIQIVPIGKGANTILPDGDLNALVCRIECKGISYAEGIFRVLAGNSLKRLIGQLSRQGFDLSPLSCIPSTLGGAIVGNAGQGPKGKWISHYVEYVDAFIDGKLTRVDKANCKFGYRSSIFKSMEQDFLVWEVGLKIPTGSPLQIKNSIRKEMKSRKETQPIGVKTSGCCFTAVSSSEPAWRSFVNAGLANSKIGGVRISPKHANFLINEENGSFENVIESLAWMSSVCSDNSRLELRVYGNDGNLYPRAKYLSV